MPFQYSQLAVDLWSSACLISLPFKSFLRPVTPLGLLIHFLDEGQASLLQIL